MIGTVKWFNKTKGFGFIKQDDGNDVFVHKSDINEVTELMEGDPVTFEIGKGPKGPKAVNVKLAELSN